MSLTGRIPTEITVLLLTFFNKGEDKKYGLHLIKNGVK